MLFLKLFRSAGATGHVFFLNKGEITNKGLAYSGLVSPWTIVAVVPTTPQIFNFSVDALTKDKQQVTVSGSLTLSLDPSAVVRKFDFTVDTSRGGFTGNWNQVLNTLVNERIVRAMNEKVRTYKVADVILAMNELEAAVMGEFVADTPELNGVIVTSCSIPSIEADEEIGETLGATEREAMLAAADKARHDRRIKAVENDRAVKELEAQTALGLEKDRAKLVAEKGKNQENEAKADAKATEIRMGALKDVEAGVLLGAALFAAADKGKLGSIAITSEFLAAAKG